MRVRDQVLRRSGGMCEAMVLIEQTGVWTRCGQRPVEIHHALTRARGGSILDEIGETYHLIALCPRCHRLADGGEAYVAAVLIEGYVSRDVEGHPVYTGPDEFLSVTYPKGADVHDH